MLVSTLDRYILRELLRTLVLALLVIVLVFAVGTVARLARDGLTYWQLLRSLPFGLVFTLPYAMPMALLIAVTLTYGRLVADREVLALQASGVPPGALFPPALAVAVVLALVSIALQSTVLPYSHRRRAEIGAAMLEEILELGEGEHWAKVFGRNGFDIYVRRHAGKSLEGIVLHRDAGPHPMTVVAERGTVSYSREKEGYLTLELEDVAITVFARAANAPHVLPRVTEMHLGDPLRVRLARYTVQAPIGGSQQRWKSADYTTTQLWASTSDPALPPGTRQDHRSELSTRAAMATAPVIFVLLGIPLTLLLRASSRLVPLVAGMVAASALYMGPLLLGVTLADRAGRSVAWPFLGDALSLPAAFALSRLLRRPGR